MVLLLLAFYCIVYLIISKPRIASQSSGKTRVKEDRSRLVLLILFGIVRGINGSIRAGHTRLFKAISIL